MCVNALVRQLTFLQNINDGNKDSDNCVNALVRATHISTKEEEEYAEAAEECQCPRTGNSHFYQAVSS